MDGGGGGGEALDQILEASKTYPFLMPIFRNFRRLFYPPLWHVLVLKIYIASVRPSSGQRILEQLSNSPNMHLNAEESYQVRSNMGK